MIGFGEFPYCDVNISRKITVILLFLLVIKCYPVEISGSLQLVLNNRDQIVREHIKKCFFYLFPLRTGQKQGFGFY